ncbi:MAG: WG repeat-containing protein, partial [Alphaproteobacteria bacterium]|nr:WG repeat-containing protein [Alphaproteobacteria bacterium]
QRGSSNPSALKERIRSYCVGKRFYWDATIRNSLVCILDKKADGKIYVGIIDATTGSVLIAPDRFDAISAHKEHGYFTKEGYAIASLEGKAVLINKSGRVILNDGYDLLSFYNNCQILKARKGSKVGIIDYQGNVLEPFVHNSFESESLAKAANRIFKEKGGEKVEIW